MQITEMLARNARMYGDETALVERNPETKERSEITWAEFYHRSNRLANSLIALSIQKGDRLVQLMTNSLEWLPVYFGILRSGAVAVPLNFRFAADDILSCTAFTEARVVIFGEAFIDRINAEKPDLDQTVIAYIYVGNADKKPAYALFYEDLLSSSSPREPKVEITLSDDAAIYFTSGTTGRPKGVVLQHRQLEFAGYAKTATITRPIRIIFFAFLLCITPGPRCTGLETWWWGQRR